MKRGMVGGAHRGPVGLGRQRRTIRIVQAILVLLGAALLVFAGYSLGRSSGYEAGRNAAALDAPREPSGAQTVVLTILGLAALGGALAVQGEGGVRLLTPARLAAMDKGAGPVAFEKVPEGAEAEERAETS